MAQERYILRYNGTPQAASEELRQIQSQGDVKIVDGSTPKSVLVEASSSVVASIKNLFSNWLVIPEKRYALPDTRAKITSPVPVGRKPMK